MAEKVALVTGVRDRYGLGPALRTVGLPRSTWYYRTRRRVPYEAKYAHLREPLEAIAEAHPEYGYRQVTSELRETYGERVNRKVVERLHRLWDLPLRRTVVVPRPSPIRQAIEVAGPRANLLQGRAKAEIGPLAPLVAGALIALPKASRFAITCPKSPRLPSRLLSVAPLARETLRSEQAYPSPPHTSSPPR